MSIDRNTAEDTCDKNRLSPQDHGFKTTSCHEQPGAMTTNHGEKPSTPQRDIAVSGHGNANLAPAERELQVSFPDGGFQAWLVVFGSFCAQGAVFGLINTAAVFESYFKAHQLKDYSNSQIGWIFSLYLFLVFFVGVQAGPVFDRHGARLLLAAGSLCVVASLMLLSISTSTCPLQPQVLVVQTLFMQGESNSIFV